MPAHDLTESIRIIFLHPDPHVSLKDARRLFAGYNRQIEELIAEKEIQTSTRRGAASLTRADMAALALAVWPLDVIEQALGEDAARALPAPLRSRAIELNLPEYQAAMLDYLAGDRGTTPGDLVSRQLHNLETEYIDVLISTVPGFAEAMNWLSAGGRAGGALLIAGRAAANAARDRIHACAHGFNPIRDGLNLAWRTVNPMCDGLNLAWRTVNPMRDGLNLASRTVNPIGDGFNLASRTVNPIRDGIHSAPQRRELDAP